MKVIDYLRTELPGVTWKERPNFSLGMPVFEAVTGRKTFTFRVVSSELDPNALLGLKEYLLRQTPYRRIVKNVTVEGQA